MPCAGHVRLSYVAAACAAGLAFTACAAIPAAQPQPASSPKPRIEAGTPPGGEDAAWARRGEPAQLAQAIELLTRRVAGNPADLAAQLKLAEAHYLMAQSIAVLGWKDLGEPAAHYEASVRVASSAAAIASESSALYWQAASRYALASQAGFNALLAEQASVRRAMTRAAELAPQTDRGGAYRVLASIAAHPAAPQLRDLKRAREYAERALAVDPAAIANTVAFIEHYAIPAQDRAAISDKLQKLTEQPAKTPEDAIARARAEQLAARIEDELE